MISSLELKLTPAEAADDQLIRQLCAHKLKCPPEQLQVVVRRRSVDARKGDPKIVLVIDAYRNEDIKTEDVVLGLVKLVILAGIVLFMIV